MPPFHLYPEFQLLQSGGGVVLTRAPTQLALRGLSLIIDVLSRGTISLLILEIAQPRSPGRLHSCGHKQITLVGTLQTFGKLPQDKCRTCGGSLNSLVHLTLSRAVAHISEQKYHRFVSGMINTTKSVRIRRRKQQATAIF